MELMDGAIKEKLAEAVLPRRLRHSSAAPLNFQAVRDQSVLICQPLEYDDYLAQPFSFVSPPKWHLGHTTWFFETFCLKAFFGYEPIDPRFNFVFNSYYESQGQRVPQAERSHLSRPTLNEVLEYRRRIDARMQEAFSKTQTLSASRKQEWDFAVQLGLHHEQQHQELLYTDIKSILFHQPGYPAYDPSFQNELKYSSSQESWQKIPEGLYSIGHGDSSFAFDNEGPQHLVYCHNFEIRESLVTNQEYQDFIFDQGYSRPELWLSDGWRWIQTNQIQAPLYWVQKDGHWFEYQLTGLENLNPEKPVSHISYFEADAFAKWKKCRLPTEAEWEVSNFQKQAGPLWQWTQSAYQSYPGYKPFDGGFVEYNGKFMSGQMVLKGGSFATPIQHYRPTYRNFFQPEMRWNFTGLRLAKSV